MMKWFIHVFVFDPFCLFALTVCAFTKPNVIQPTPVMVAKLGGSVTLTCFRPNVSVTSFDWFKQSIGQKPLHMASSPYIGQDSFYSNNFIKDFTETKRLGVRRGLYTYNLTISKTEPGDSATYYCSTRVIYELTIGEGTVLIVKESNSMSVLQQPVSDSVQPGDSVTLNCTIHTETCAGEHSVYWFRHGSGESRPGIIYTHGNRSDQCEKSTKAGSPTQSCVYNLPKRNLSLSDAGTYYCAVASCGEILFGDGTKLELQGKSHLICTLPQQYCIFMQTTYLKAIPYIYSDVLNYAAVSFTPKKKSSSRTARKKTSREDAVYSDVRYLQQQ
uniref:Ig-like domain-containing protein n=1 Tax=Oncorhynchus kisutch TaxID=8019 RepID=A0A8C7CUI8_ONCKI